MKIVAISGNAGAGKDTAADRLVDKHGYVRISLADPIKRFGKDIFGFSTEQLWGPSEARNKHDPRFNQYSLGTDMDAAWKAAYLRLEEQADDWIDGVVGYGYAHKNTEYLDKLVAWFHKLGTEHPKLSPRVMLQTLGTEWGRSVDPDIWVNYFMRTSYKVLAGEGMVGYSQSRGLYTCAAQQPEPKGVVVSDVRFINEINALKQIKSFLVRVRRDDIDDAALQLGIANHQSEAEQQGVSDDVFNMVINNNGSLDKLMDAVDMIPHIAKG